VINRKIHAGIKAMVVPRYRYITQVIIIEKNDQQALVTSRSIWDEDRDKFSLNKYRFFIYHMYIEDYTYVSRSTLTSET
jgi:hypothetical protein